MEMSHWRILKEVFLQWLSLSFIMALIDPQFDPNSWISICHWSLFLDVTVRTFQKNHLNLLNKISEIVTAKVLVQQKKQLKTFILTTSFWINDLNWKLTRKITAILNIHTTVIIHFLSLRCPFKIVFIL